MDDMLNNERLFFLLDLALYQFANQSSTLYNHTANRAVDGDKLYSCATTLSQQDPWWRVDLGSSLVVAKVIVSYEHRMEGLEIRIGEFRALRRKAQIRGVIYFGNSAHLQCIRKLVDLH